ncbi:MAG: hypothetical protein OEU50_21200 [Gammaproteobacteria bacterium]|nr:hypothetical protein [Gammaproteobacteria bacterium]
MPEPVFHMLSCFDLKPGEDIETFRGAYLALVEKLKNIGLVETSGAIGRRQSDTPMDTDDERRHQYFALMSFRNRAQVDAAYAHIMKHEAASDEAHDGVYTRVLDPVFICWQDLDLNA